MPDQPLPDPHERWKNMSFSEALQHLIDNAPAEAFRQTVFEEDLDWI